MGQLQLLSNVHLKRIWPDLYFPLLQKMDFRWSNPQGGRIPTVPASWGEIQARGNSRIQIAPIIGRGQSAPIKTPNDVLRLEQSTIPKIKHGVLLDETTLRDLEAVSDAFGGVPSMDNELVQNFVNYESSKLKELALGCTARREHMTIGMLLDTYTYANEHGMQFSMTWGAPSDSKLTVGTAWGDGTIGMSHAATGAKVIDDIQTFLTNLSVTYGKDYDRASMSRQTALYMIGTDQFRAMAPIFWSQAGLAPTVTQLPFNNFSAMVPILEKILGLSIEIDDRQVQQEQIDMSLWNAPPNAPAAGQYIRYQPANVVIFTNSQDDGSAMAWDVANLPVAESYPGRVPGMIGGQPTAGGSRGPFQYASALSLSGDPVGTVLFSVEESLPRKVDLLCAASMTVW